MNALIYESLVNLLMKGKEARLEQIRRAWRAYHGALSKPLKVRSGEIDDNVYANVARLVVDNGVSFLFGKAVEFEIDETEETLAEQYLTKVWNDNKKMSLLQRWALNGGVSGHGFIKIVERPGDVPRLSVLDSESVHVKLEPDDYETLCGYVIAFPSVDPETNKPILVRQRIEQDGRGWIIIDEQADAKSLHWREVKRTDWRYSFSPIVDNQNLPAPNTFWGESDLSADVIAMQESINFTLRNIGRILRFHAHPKTWGSGFSADELKIAVDETLVFPNKDARLQNLEMQSDLESSLKFYQQLKGVFHQVTRVPEVVTGKVDNVGQLSGTALQILYRPIMEKTEVKRVTYGDALVELNRRLLAMGGFGDANFVTLHWPNLLPRNSLAARNTALLDQQLGVSQDTVLQRLGFDPALEREKRAADSAALGEQMLAAFDKGL